MKKATGPVNGLTQHRDILFAKRSELLSDIRSKLGALIGPGPAAPEDLSPVFHDQFVALQINRLDFLQFKLVDDALNRMGSEKYGVCVDCGDAISRRRLKAIPWAIRCIACQEQLNSACESAQFAEMAF